MFVRISELQEVTKRDKNNNFKIAFINYNISAHKKGRVKQFINRIKADLLLCPLKRQEYFMFCKTFFVYR